jgi:hypothetical protein
VNIDGEKEVYTVCSATRYHDCGWDDMRYVGKGRIGDITVVPDYDQLGYTR